MPTLACSLISTTVSSVLGYGFEVCKVLVRYLGTPWVLLLIQARCHIFSMRMSYEHFANVYKACYKLEMAESCPYFISLMVAHSGHTVGAY